VLLRPEIVQPPLRLMHRQEMEAHVVA